MVRERMREIERKKEIAIDSEKKRKIKRKKSEIDKKG